MTPLKNVWGTILALIVITGASGLGAGCSTVSAVSGYTQASNEDAARVEKGEYSRPASAQIVVVQNPDINGGILSPQALMKIQQYNISCQQQVLPQIAGPVQSGVTGAVTGGIAGATGVGGGAVVGFSHAAFPPYAAYGGIADAAAYGLNGLITGSYAAASAIGTCTRDFWEDKVRDDPAFAGAHVEVVYAGKAWGDSHPPALDHSIVTAPPLKQ